MADRLPRPRRWLRIVCAAAVSVTLAGPSLAGTEHIPNGLSDFMGGVLPPPGFYWLNYLLYLNRDKLKDDNGKNTNGVDVKASAYVDAVRLVYMTPFKILGATYGAQVIFPLYTASFKLDVQGPGNLDDSTSTGVGDITINPIILAWHFSPNFHVGAGLDIVVPTGPYKKDWDEHASQLLNKNHWTAEPLVAVSYWFPGGWDASAKIMYDFHGENKDYPVLVPVDPEDPSAGVRQDNVTMKPGQEFHFDWALSHAVGSEDLRMGIAGFYYQNTTADEVDGEKQGKSKLMAIGPAFKYWPKMGKLSVTGKFLKEFNGKNYAEGQSLWIDTVYAF